ncbi:MAG: ATP-binding cassette domain-containing protein [Rhodomicrobiaceae bacterium]
MVFISALEGISDPLKISPLLNVKDLSMGCGSHKIIENLNLSVCPGKVMGVFGESKSGKAMILDLLSGQTSPSSGHIVFKGEDVTTLSSDARQERGICYTLAPEQLFADLSVLENMLLLGAQASRPFYSREGGASHADEAMELLEFVGLAEKADDKAGDLSAVEQCLLTSAIALAGNPVLLLLRAPTLRNTTSRKAISSLLKRISKRGVTVIFTSQDKWQVMEICDKIVVFSEGTIVARGTPAALSAEMAIANAHPHYVQ